MEAYRQNIMACFGKVLAEPLQLERDWRMALVEIILSTSIKIVTTKEYFVYTQKTLFNNSPSVGNTSSGGVMVKRADWSNNAFFLDGEYKTVEDVVMRLHVVVARSTRPLVTSNSEED